jgi:hypothetical protein
MSSLTMIEVLLGRCALPFALLINPLLLARWTHPAAGRDRLTLPAALWALVLQPLIALGLHLGGIPIAPSTVAGVNFALTAVAAAGLRLARRPLLPAHGAWPRTQFGLFAATAILLFPFTHLAGIDPYKWADLATAVAADRRITWLVHPLSLLGFTPRSYPSLHPLLMGTIQALGSLRVEASFYLTGLVLIATGITTAEALGRTVNPPRPPACADGQAGFTVPFPALFAIFYILSPVFIRYAHWCTGRGAFLAVLPLFVVGLLRLPRARAWGLAGLGAVLAVLSHKTGLIAVVVLPLLRLAAPLFPRRRPRVCATLLLCVFAASLAFAPPRYMPPPLGWLAGWIRYDLARFAWISPALLVFALLRPAALFRPSDSRFMWLSALALFPAAHHMEMYPALIALPFLVFAGMAGLRAALGMTPERTPAEPGRTVRSVVIPTALVVTLLAALAIVIQRSVEALPGRVYRAARFIERIDPEGPFEVMSPWRTRIQGMVTGCPRFTVSLAADAAVSVAPPPTVKLSARRLVDRWVGYLRWVFRVDTTAALYGKPLRRYYVLEHDAPAPPGAERIYEQDGIAVYRETL